MHSFHSEWKHLKAVLSNRYGIVISVRLRRRPRLLQIYKCGFGDADQEQKRAGFKQIVWQDSGSECHSQPSVRKGESLESECSNRGYPRDSKYDTALVARHTSSLREW